MGEKGNAVGDVAAAGSSSFISETVETTTTVVGDAAGTMKEKLVDRAVDHGLDEARERLRREDPDQPSA